MVLGAAIHREALRPWCTLETSDRGFALMMFLCLSALYIPLLHQGSKRLRPTTLPAFLRH